MLREAFEYLTTPCPPLARRYGYLAEAVALGARHRRQRRGKGWLLYRSDAAGEGTRGETRGGAAR
ncbi:hypothetical protein GAY28_09790 [Azospirillum brasilense]|nr:hypothetical protein [Azospirillum brasilense]